MATLLRGGCVGVWVCERVRVKTVFLFPLFQMCLALEFTLVFMCTCCEL